MGKSIDIMAAVSLILVVLISFYTHYCCNICVLIFVGIIAGYLAGVYAKPQTGKHAAGIGAGAGAVSGLIAMFGQMAGHLLSGLSGGNSEFWSSLDLISPFAGPSFLSFLSEQTRTFIIQFLMVSSCGIIDVMLLAGLGVLGGLFWRQTHRKSS